MEFEYDDNKSRMNKEKHGIDFIEAQNLWNDKNALIIPANTTNGEIRYALISKLMEKCFVAIFMFREDIFRIISVRRCRKKEEKNYETNNS